MSENNYKKKWYALQTLSGFEKKVLTAIQNLIELEDLGEKIEKVVFPEEEVQLYRSGRRYNRVKKVLPSYIFIKMVDESDIFYKISNIEGVLKFIGTKNKPSPIPEREVMKITGKVEGEKIVFDFEPDTYVRIIDGPFKDFDGLIKEVYPEKERVKVIISVFGRKTPIELDFDQIVPITEKNK